jgi:hypothetical protein
MDIKSLKATAYDLLAQLEYIQKQLQETNAKIGEEMQKENDEKNKLTVAENS